MIKAIKSKLYYSVPEVASLLNISRQAVLMKIKNGQLKAEKVGRNYIIKRAELEEFLPAELTETIKKRIDLGVTAVIKQYGDVLKKLGNE